MSPLTKSLTGTLRRLLSFLVHFAPVRACLVAWYRLSLKCLPLIVSGRNTHPIQAIFTRHQNWILGISDIDLIVLFDDSNADPERAGEREMFVKFWRRYIALRFAFPMLCGVSEIRWIPLSCLRQHPLHHQPEVRLLINPELWSCVFTRKGTTPVDLPIFNPPSGNHLPFTMFLDFNLYGYLQRQLFSNGDQPGLRIERMAKCAMKIVQHLHYFETDRYEAVPSIQDRLRQEPKDQPWKRYRAMLRGLLPGGPGELSGDPEIARSVYTLIVELSRAHESIINSGWSPEDPAQVRPAHIRPAGWQGTCLDRFLLDVERRFGNRISLVAFRSPYKQYQTRLFVLIAPGMTFEDFYEFVVFARDYQEALQAEKVLLNATTPALLTSQCYAQWGHVALEGYILAAQGVYAPRGGLNLRVPAETWTLQKIRESIAVFEEFYLPFLVSPLAKGEGMDFCKIYERAETEMLFHYYCYLKDRTGYLDLLRQTHGSVDEVIAYGCARYGNEIGIQNWHPIRFTDSYPYLKSMIRRIDQMAIELLEGRKSEAQSSI